MVLLVCLQMLFHRWKVYDYYLWMALKGIKIIMKIYNIYVFNPITFQLLLLVVLDLHYS
jgi:hypothetical protein